jgi:hypothetical protein
MLRWLGRLILYRFLGAKLMLGLAVFGWLRSLLGKRRDPRASTDASLYQPSQGSSQIVHREPR